jgi:hypothetical protein
MRIIDFAVTVDWASPGDATGEHRALLGAVVERPEITRGILNIRSL